MWHILIALHGEGLPATSLTVDKDGGMEAHEYLFDQEIGPGSLENTLLSAAFIEYLVKFITFHVTLLVYDSIKW